MPPGEPQPQPQPQAQHEAGGALFESVFTTDQLAAATSDRAWVGAMLEFEAALAVAEAKVGLVPEEAAKAIARACREIDLDPVALGRAGRLGSNPAIPLVSSLRARLPDDVGRWLHFGATSQDVLDSAMMLVLRSVVRLALVDLGRLAAAAAKLAERYRSAPMVARTLLQHALPTTFGRKAAGWLVAVVEASEALQEVGHRRLAVQLGGAAGTLASLGSRGPQVVEVLAAELDLEVPVLPWHTDRTRVGEVSCALALCAGVAGKVALDVSLLMQTEVGEAFEPPAEGRGASSSLPHKRNPAMAATVLAAFRRAQGLASIVLAGMPQEHERAVGAWQAEWETVSELSRAAGGAVAIVADMLAGLEVDEVRMAVNLQMTGGLVLAERVTAELASVLGHEEARGVVEAASKRAVSSSTTLEQELRNEPGVAELWAGAGLPGDMFEPGGSLGSSEYFVDRALDLYGKVFGKRANANG
ncbi:MAG TPA: 3-carboxy-cis,cis-muconate cycloisomerase [Acidimicrobiales bacterium]|nr:3-carboxy-cis,cis-muconate cycloisomerase [Acidimicrobiales bacterium]